MTAAKNTPQLIRVAVTGLLLALVLAAWSAAPVGAQSPTTTRIDFTYADRNAFLAGGWDFLARESAGAQRNTEQLSGHVVSYSQLAHPGVLRVPADAGDLWANANDSRNTIFRDLPASWQRIQLRVAAFAPDTNYQGVCLLAYEDDDNYVAVCRDFVNGQAIEWWRETGGGPVSLAVVPGVVITNFHLRLDRNPATDIFTASVSTDDGVTWTQLGGSASMTLTNPRLGILVGANTSSTSFPTADLSFVEITAASQTPTLGVSPSSFTFSAVPGGANPASQTLNITNLGPGTVTWTASDNQPWLTLSPASGTAPTAVSLNVSTAGLAAGTYNATITVTSPEATNSPRTVPVTLVLQSPTLGLSPTSLSFSWTQGTAVPASQTLDVSNTGGGTLSFTVSDNQSWLTVSPTSGTAPSTLTVSVAPGALAPGTHNATITVTSSQAVNSPQLVPVTFTVSPPPAVLTVSPASLSFSANQGGANPPAQTIAISNTGGGTLNWTASDNQPWLAASPGSGSAPATLTVSISIAGLAPGTYNGTVTVTAPGAANSPRTIPVTLTVATPPSLSVSPTGLSFTDTQGGGNPANQAISVINLGGGPMNWTVSDNQSWLSVSPGSGSASGSTIVSINSAGLAPGNYNGTVTVTAPGATNSPRTVAVTLTVTAAPVLSATPANLTFNGQQGAPNPGSQSVSITTTGGDAVAWTASVNQPWVSINRTSGTAPSSIAVSAISTGLTPGTYNATLTVTASGATGSPKNIGITFVVDPPGPALRASPVGLAFGGVAGASNPAAQTLSVTNLASGSLSWSATASQPWINLSPASGSTPGAITVSASTAGLAVGTYMGTITLSSAGATNSPQLVPVSLVVVSSASGIDFTYANRSALLADGWDFTARTAGGGPRNTEQTSGLVVDYNQVAHPGTLRIPTDAGTLWAASNDTRNTLFRDLPSDWLSIRLKIAAYAPTALYHSACLLAYQNDDNYVTVCRDFVNSQFVEWWHETSGSPSVLGALGVAATSNVMLRLDRNPSTNVLTAFYSGDGGSVWTPLPSSVTKTLSSPRLGVFVGGNVSPSNPVADLAFVEIVRPAGFATNVASLSAGGSTGGPNPASQYLIVTNSGPGTLAWTASVNQPWVTIDSVSGSTPSVVTLSFSTAGLSPGTYNATLTLSSSQGGISPKLVPLTLTVGPPALMTTPTTLSFEGSVGGATPAAQTLNVGNVAGSPINWSVSTDQAWLAAGPGSGTTPTAVSVTVSIAGLTQGTYTGSVRLASAEVTNSPLVVPVTLVVSPMMQQTHYDFTYASRSALLADGWDFMARTASGAGRNTEQTTGLVVDYNQSVHPGVVRVPTDVGTPWSSNNNTRNTIFRDLPTNWRSIRVKFAAFSPSGPYQSACLLAYQSDDHYVALCRDFVGAQTIEWWDETGGGPNVLGVASSSVTSNFALRLDRVPETNLVTGFVSTDGGASWSQLSGSVFKALASPRLGIFVGGNASGSVPNADIASADVIAPMTILPTPTLATSSASLSYTGIAGGSNPSSQVVSVTNAGPGTLTWSVSDNQPWLTVSPASGSAPGALTVSVSLSGLAPGAYSATITLTSSQAGNSPKTIPVSLNVVSLNTHRLMNVAVLVNGANASGYNPSPTAPGEFQRYPERYLEHLQVPYDVINVATTPPPADLFDRQLIVGGHRGLNLSTAWQDAIAIAVAMGAGFVNLDWDPAVGAQVHMQTIFGAIGSQAGTAGQAVIVPAAVVPGGAAPHYIAGLQRRFSGDPAGDLTYLFHRDAQNVQQTAQSTILTGSTATVIARIGADPLIVATPYGAGRAVHVGTLQYLSADRFGFLKGVDDLFWRSLVWAARKPFALRGYPRFWSVQMDDTQPGWASRVRDMYDPAFTGTISPSGIGGPWKVTGYVFTFHLGSGSGERASVLDDIANDLLQVSPHSFEGAAFGDMYWNEQFGQLSDSQWQNSLNDILSWSQGLGGSDMIPLSRSMVAHYWDLSNNTGWDMWNQLGFRYITSIQKPGFQRLSNYGGQERLNVRPFWLYQMPPKLTPDEDHPFFFADDLVVGSRSGLPSQTFFLFATQVQGIGVPRPDVSWPSAVNPFGVPWSVQQSVDQFERSTWRLWSSLGPMQIFTHDSVNYQQSTVADRRAVIQSVSSWLNAEGVRHLFMEDLGDYIYARTKSTLTRSEIAGGNITYGFSGNAATSVGATIATELRLYLGDNEGTTVTIPGFSGGFLTTVPVGGP